MRGNIQLLRSYEWKSPQEPKYFEIHVSKDHSPGVDKNCGGYKRVFQLYQSKQANSVTYLNRTQNLSGVWLGVDLRTNTKKTYIKELGLRA